MVTALMHGNEICGAIALDRLLHAGVRPARGKLTFAFCNVAAYRAFNRVDPATSRYVDEDMNRVWDRSALEGPRNSQELRRARILRPLIDTVDYLLDIHSTTNINPAMMLTGLAQKHLDFAEAIGFPVYLVRDSGHEGGQRLRDYGASPIRDRRRPRCWSKAASIGQSRPPRPRAKRRGAFSPRPAC